MIEFPKIFYLEGIVHGFLRRLHAAICRSAGWTALRDVR